MEDIIKQIKEERSSRILEFNNGICKETCNCAEIAESENGNDNVKNYKCLGVDISSLSEYKNKY